MTVETQLGCTSINKEFLHLATKDHIYPLINKLEQHHGDIKSILVTGYNDRFMPIPTDTASELVKTFIGDKFTKCIEENKPIIDQDKLEGYNSDYVDCLVSKVNYYSNGYAHIPNYSPSILVSDLISGVTSCYNSHHDSDIAGEQQSHHHDEM